MNIRVDLNTPIKDGMDVVFRSPVDCSQITGLILYYNGESKEFAFADAHGNDVGHIDNLFAENAVVKVILDLDTNMAFVQNADTNAYLEGRFASLPMEIIDKLCPSFSESGSVVTCEPVEGYPLTVTAEEGATQITRCGKNLFNYKDWVTYANSAHPSTSYPAREEVEFLGRKCFSYHPYRSNKDLYFTDIRFKPNTQYTIKMQIAMTYGSNTEYAVPAMLFIYTDGSSSYIPATSTTVYSDKFVEASVTSTAGKTISMLSIPSFATGATLYIPVDSCVIEEGTTAEYAPYTGDTFAPGEPIPAIQGVNHIFADTGDVTVEGKADPVAIINKLTNAILSLGGNV